MSEVIYTIDVRAQGTKEHHNITSVGYPKKFLRDVFDILKRIYGFNEELLKHIIQEDVIKALEDNDICYLEVKQSGS